MALGTEQYTRDNLVTLSKGLITDDLYTTATAITRGMVLKNTAGVLSACATTETPFTIALADADGSVSPVAATYMVEGSVMESEVTYNTGTAGEFRDALRAVGIVTER